MAQVLDYALQGTCKPHPVRDRFKDFRETRLSTVRPLNEFVDYHRISRPRDTNEAVQRLTYNTRHFSGNYAVVIVLLAVYGLYVCRRLTQHHGAAPDCRGRHPRRRLHGDQPLRYVVRLTDAAPEPMQVGNHVVTQKGLYTALFVVGTYARVSRQASCCSGSPTPSRSCSGSWAAVRSSFWVTRRSLSRPSRASTRASRYVPALTQTV